MDPLMIELDFGPCPAEKRRLRIARLTGLVVGLVLGLTVGLLL